MSPEPNVQKTIVHHQGGGSGGVVYGLGLIGACVYYIGRGKTNEEKAKGFLKALVWPAYLVYDLLVFLEKPNPEAQEPVETN